MSHRITLVRYFFGLILFLSVAGVGLADDANPELKKEATWTWADIGITGEQLRSYLDLAQVSQEQRALIEQAWVSGMPKEPGPQLLDHVLNISSMVDPRVAQFLAKLNQASHAGDSAGLSDLTWMDSKIPGWLQDNIKLAVGRHLAQVQLFDEASAILATLDEKTVVDPSTLLFYRAACSHHLLQRDECVATLDRLLERENELPSRFAVTARLMRSDIEPLKEDSLDEVSRLMKDVERRLALGRAGNKVQAEENEIVKKLEKVIEQIEQQLQQQQAKSQQPQDAQQSQNKPMDTSMPAGNSGPGDVAPKDIGSKSGWGNLPPAQRQEALQNITKDLPSHYREVIEAYFKRLGKGD
jgi:hypothetical protein